MLRVLGARYGFKAEKIDPVRYKDFVVSSTRIRRLIGEGRVDEAGALLGHQYFVDGTVVRGDGARPDDRLSDRQPLHRATSCCRRTASTPPPPPSTASSCRRSPTSASGRRSTSPAGPSIETHIFNFDRDLYGATVRVGFVQRLRDERALRVARRAEGADRRRLRPGARAVRSAFAVESRHVSDPGVLLRARALPAETSRRHCCASSRRRSRARRRLFAPGGAAELAELVRSRRGRRRRAAAAPPASCGFDVQGGELDDRRCGPTRGRVWQTSRSVD